ncbi:MAG: bifunctional folylpolyglutamate synthase/dihydrofolate synthase [Planctomycetaceae bacterium]|nr:bifunctional folylpolyglutamate synthase/dihydrofolate synthase [Planctomycetaceae bacterium]
MAIDLSRSVEAHLAHAAADPACADYEQELAYVFGRLNYEHAPQKARSIEDFQLGRMRELLARLGQPQRRIPCVHIAGSKGKGSVATMVARILQAAGLRVGLFTSPHLNDYRERMTVNRELPARAELLPLMQRLRQAATEMRGDSKWGEPTFFELTTALGWLTFERREVDFVALEVGLGGRLDSTNICAPLVSVITSISHDHNRLLGSTLTQIAREKAGIIKPYVPVVSGVLVPEAQEVIAAKATAHKTPCLQLGREFTYELQLSAACDHRLPPAIQLSTHGPDRDVASLELGLRGSHQARNAAVAVAAVEMLCRAGLRIDVAAIQAGLRAAVVPGRIELLQERPRVYIDAAHNEASIEALCQTLQNVTAHRRRVIFAASRDKDVPAMLRHLIAFADELIVTRYCNNPRAVAPEDLATMARPLASIPISIVADPESALQACLTTADPDDLIVCTGSLFLAAEIREKLVRH